MTGQFIFRCIFTAILLFSIFYVWTNPIDVTKTITKLFTSMVSFKPQVTFANYDNAFAVRYFQKGSTVDANLAPLFNDINVVNPSDDNVTIKSVHLRYQIDGANQEVESSVLTTGRVLTPNGDSNSIIVRSSTANNFFMSWKNLRMEIAEHKPIGRKEALWLGAQFSY
jgi:hypothetical protein